jgi:hypothetical protein
VFTTAGAKAHHGEVTIYHDLCTMAEPFARCGKWIVLATIKVPAVVSLRCVLGSVQPLGGTKIGVNTLFGDSTREESKSIYYDDV